MGSAREFEYISEICEMRRVEQEYCDSCYKKSKYNQYVEEEKEELRKENRKSEIVHKAWERYGVDKQLWVTIEELSELQKAIAKYIRKGTDKEKADIEEEIADAEFMIFQLKQGLNLNQENIDNNYNFKVDRLKANVEVEESK